MIKLFLIIAIIFMAGLVMAGNVKVTNVTNGGYIATRTGTGYVVFTSTPAGVVAGGTTGQCMGLLCGVTYPN